MLVMVLIWILNSLFSLISKKFGLNIDRSILSCGITAYSGSKPADPDKIKMIMMYNQERGEDSTGWAVNNKIIKDTEKVMKFIQKNPLIITPEDDNFTIVAHARKASSGLRYSKELAHPFGIYENDTEKEDYDLILAMNGTLSNTELLANRWDIEFKTNTNSDTQMLAKAMVKLGEENYREALELYDGWATLAFFHPLEKNTLMIYKDPDRPLYLWNIAPDQMYISSMEEPLLAIGAAQNELKYFKPNFLYKIVEGKITYDKIVDRKPLKPIVTYPIGNRIGYKKGKHYNTDYETWQNQGGESFIEMTSKKDEVILIKNRPNESKNHDNRGNKVYTINERYYRNGHPLEGKNFITDIGKMKSELEAVKLNMEPMFFICGYKCLSEKAYDTVFERVKDQHDKFSLDKFKSIRVSEFVEFFSYPVLTLIDEEEGWILDNHYTSSLKKRGDTLSFSPFLSDEEFKLIFRCKWTKITKKVICDNIGFRKKEVSVDADNDDLTSIESEVTTRAWLIDKFKTEESDNPNYYYTITRRDLWRVNTSDSLKKYFFELIMRIGLNYLVVSKVMLKDLRKEAEVSMFSGKQFLKDMEKITSLIKTKVKDEDISNMTNHNMHISTDLTTKEKIQIHEQNQNIFTEDDIINSIKCCNILYKSPNFANDIHEAKEEILDDLKTSWVVNNSDKELYDFYEAVLLSLNTVERISKSELLYALESDPKDLSAKAHSTYREWHNFMRDCGDLQISENECVRENSKEIVVEPEAEVLDAEYYESSFLSELEELLESVKEIKGRMDKTETNLRTERFNKLNVSLAGSIMYISKILQ